MRLLHVIGGAVFGGAHNQAVRLAPFLAEEGWETIVVLPEERGDALDRLHTSGLDVITIPLDRLRMTPDVRSQARFAFRFRSQMRSLRELIRKLEVDLVQLPGLTNPQPAIAAHREGVAVVWQLLDTRAPRVLRRTMMPLVTRLADAVMSTGLTVARSYPGAIELGPRLVPFLPPVGSEEFRPDRRRREVARQTLAVRDDDLVVGTVGNRNPQKGHEYLIRALKIIRQRHPEVALRIRGSVSPVHPAYEQKLQRELGAAGLNARSIREVEPGMSVAGLLPGFDVFALTSVPRSEGVPTVILEAMACALPVVATDVGGVREIVDHGHTGYVVPARDPEAIAEALSGLVDDPERRVDVGLRARRRVEEDWTIADCVEAHLRAYETALAVRANRR